MGPFPSPSPAPRTSPLPWSAHSMDSYRISIFLTSAQSSKLNREEDCTVGERDAFRWRILWPEPRAIPGCLVNVLKWSFRFKSWNNPQRLWKQALTHMGLRVVRRSLLSSSEMVDHLCHHWPHHLPFPCPWAHPRRILDEQIRSCLCCFIPQLGEAPYCTDLSWKKTLKFARSFSNLLFRSRFEFGSAFGRLTLELAALHVRSSFFR